MEYAAKLNLSSSDFSLTPFSHSKCHHRGILWYISGSSLIMAPSGEVVIFCGFCDIMCSNVNFHACFIVLDDLQLIQHYYTRLVASAREGRDLFLRENSQVYAMESISLELCLSVCLEIDVHTVILS